MQGFDCLLTEKEVVSSLAVTEYAPSFLMQSCMFQLGEPLCERPWGRDNPPSHICSPLLLLK